MAESDDLAQIIRGCKENDGESFSRLLELYSSRLYGYFYRLTGNRQVSDDLLGELFVKLVGKIGSYGKGSFDCWLFRIASNIFHDYLRKKQRYSKLVEFEKERLKSNISEPKKNESESFDRLEIQLKKLDSDTRELIMLRFYSEMNFKEISQFRSEPIGTTLSKYYRGIKKLREMME
jgi:RNA polymerase sigma-70 factor (ECF subfamily)